MNGVNVANQPILLVRREPVVVDYYNHMMNGVDVTDQPISFGVQCIYGQACPEKKCGKDSANMQRGRSRCGFWCPACDRAFHPECCNKYHGWGDYPA